MDAAEGGGACAGHGADRRARPRRARALPRTEPACASAARRNGCIRWQPKPSRFTASAPSAARCRKASKGASSSMTASNPTASWTAPPAPRPCALQRPSLCANSRRSSRSTTSPGRRPCAIVSATPARRSGKPAPAAKPLSPRRARSLPCPLLGGPAPRPRLASQPAPARKGRPKSGRTKRRAGDNLLLRLHRFKDDVLQVPGRLRGPLHQQSRRTGAPHDESEDENLRRLPDPRGRSGFRRPALRHRHSAKTRPKHPPIPRRRAHTPSPKLSLPDIPGWAVTE